MNRIANVSLVFGLCFLWVACVVFTTCKPEKTVCPGTAPVASQKVSEDEVKIIMALKPVIDRRWNPPLCFLVSEQRENEYEDVVVAVPCRAFLKNRPLTSPKPVALNHATVIPTPLEKRLPAPTMKLPVPSTFKRKKQKRALHVPILKVPLPVKMQ